jgi:HK97 family phage portal protein
MAWFNKNRKTADEEQRAITSLPWVAGGPKPSQVTVENAASLVPVFACTRILADNIASFPIEAFRVSQGELTPQKFIPPLFYAPSARDDKFVWMHKCVVSLCLRGNAYGLVVERDKLGFPSMVEWLFPDDVFVDESSPVNPVYYWQGKPQNTSDIVHIPWITMPGRVVGMSPIRYFASTLGVGLAATQYGQRWFDSGGAPPSVLKNTQKTVNPDEAKEIRKRAVQSIRSGEPLVTGNDWDFTAIQVNAEESQFLATMKLNATQIAAIYGVPPTMVSGEAGGSMTYANVEQEANNLITLTFRPWLVRLETAFSALLANAEAVRFNVDSMIRTSTIDRYTAYNLALAGGWVNVDWVRSKENLPPLPNGEGKTYRKPTPPPTVAPAPPSDQNPNDATPPKGVGNE